MSGETFNNATVHINIGKQFEFPKRLKEQDKEEYEKFAIDYVMKKIAELLPEKYRGIYK